MSNPEPPPGPRKTVHHELTKEEAAPAREVPGRDMCHRALFETAAVSLWEEDFSEVKRYLEALCGEGGSGLDERLRADPEAVRQAAARVRLLDVNPAWRRRTRRSFWRASSATSIGALSPPSATSSSPSPVAPAASTGRRLSLP